MKKDQIKTEETPKQPAQKQERSPRKPYTAPKLTIHGSLGNITAGSGKTWQPTS